MNFWCIFEPHFFRVYYFSSKQEACQEVLLEQEVNEIMSGCHPSYLKTVSQQVVSRIRTHSLRFLTPNTAILVGIIHIHTNFGCLKWLVKMVKSPKKLYLGDISISECIIPSISRTHQNSRVGRFLKLGKILLFEPWKPQYCLALKSVPKFNFEMSSPSKIKSKEN